MSSSLTATSVDISWTQATNILPIDRYEVSLSYVPGNDKQDCFSFTDTRSQTLFNLTSIKFNNLEEFSIYRVIVNGFALGAPSGPSVIEFTTLSAGIF